MPLGPVFPQPSITTTTAATMTGTPLDARFALREERFEHAGFHADVLLPTSSEALINDEEFGADERLPYWAELWPAAVSLTRLLLEAPTLPTRAIELGCGVGLPSVALRSRGVDVLATDYYADALDFARANAERNGAGPLRTLLLDWRTPPDDVEIAPLVLAADVLYELRNVETLRNIAERTVSPGGAFLLADPGRLYLSDFLAAMREAGWTVQTLPERDERAPAGKGLKTRVCLFRLTRSE